MKLNQPTDSDPSRREAFFSTLASAPARALLLDYDGTLAPFVTEREQALPYPGLRELLREIIDFGHTRVAMITGRRCDDLIPLLGILPPPEIWGAHGWEHRLPDGEVTVAPMPEHAVRGMQVALEWVEAEGLTARGEIKPGSLALHVRGMAPDEARELLERTHEQWLPLASVAGLELLTFDGGLELRIPGRSKGDAVRAMLSELPAGSAIAFLGDDLTDEDAFAALAGHGLNVLVRPEFRPTNADIWLRPPSELFEFLNEWKRLAEKVA